MTKVRPTLGRSWTKLSLEVRSPSLNYSVNDFYNAAAIDNVNYSTPYVAGLLKHV